MNVVDSDLMKSGDLSLLGMAECWGISDAELSLLFVPRESDLEVALRYGIDTKNEVAIHALRISSLLGI